MHSRFEGKMIDIQKISMLSPNQMSAWNNFLGISEKASTIDPKFRELILIALSILSKNDWHMTCHVIKAQELGASKQDIIEAGWLAVLMGGDPLIGYLHNLYEILEESKDIHNKNRRVKVTRALDEENKILQEHLIDYLKCVCDEVEFMYKGNFDRKKLALKIAELDGSMLNRLIQKECRKRGWAEKEI